MGLQTFDSRIFDVEGAIHEFTVVDVRGEESLTDTSTSTSTTSTSISRMPTSISMDSLDNLSDLSDFSDLEELDIDANDF